MLLSTIGCSSDQLHFQSKELPLGWYKDSTLVFSLPVLDTVTPYGLQFSLRNTDQYAYSNLFLITTLQAPNGKAHIDTLEYVMATSQGKWLGTSKLSSVTENLLWYKDQYQFSEKGQYTVTVRQVMRHPNKVNGILNLEGITDFGVRLITLSDSKK